MADADRSFDRQRAEMVRTQIAGRGLDDPRLLRAFLAVPRERFVDAVLAEWAYLDHPLPIGGGQTISQPYVVAVMADLLRLAPGDRVLEIGTGSGYAAAILAHLAGAVYSVERQPELAAGAAERLAALGLARVHVRCGDGTLGWPEHAPYDAIVVTAGGPVVPETLKAQLAVGGRLVMPVGATVDEQALVRVTRATGGAFTVEDFGPVRFVPLVGAEGWPDDEAAGG